MEINEDGFLEELLALKRETTSWDDDDDTNHPSTTDEIINGYFSNPITTTTVSAAAIWPVSSHFPADVANNNNNNNNNNSAAAVPSSIILPTNNSSFSSSLLDDPTSLDCSSFADFYAAGPLSGPDPTGPYSDYGPIMDDDEQIVVPPCKAEPPSSLSSADHHHVLTSSTTTSSFHDNNNISGLCMDNMTTINHNHNIITNNGTPNKSSSKVKKVEGQPSKNLMAERRRRKRLNDRLSMLRSVVPKISKMDRTSILGDTIDYMKELLERINNLQEEVDVASSSNHHQLNNVMSVFKDVDKPNDVLVRNSPTFDVERRNLDTRVEICCAGKPGLLLSTVTTLEALGLEIQQCVISCFNDFSLQASCSEEMEHRTLLDSEDIKQALFRNAGYGGRCL